MQRLFVCVLHNIPLQEFREKPFPRRISTVDSRSNKRGVDYASTDRPSRNFRKTETEGSTLARGVAWKKGMKNWKKTDPMYAVFRAQFTLSDCTRGCWNDTLLISLHVFREFPFPFILLVFCSSPCCEMLTTLQSARTG